MGIISFTGTVREFRSYLSEWRRLERRDRLYRLITKPGKQGTACGSRNQNQATGQKQYNTPRGPRKGVLLI